MNRRVLLVAYVSSAAWSFTFGLGAPLSAIWMRERGSSDSAIGMNASAHYLGVVAASLVVPSMLRRWGRPAIVAGMIISGFTVAAFPWADAVWMWFLIRLIEGMATALSVIPTETLVNWYAPPDERAKCFGVYAVCVALGLAGGNLVGLNMAADAPTGAFALAGFVGVAAGWVVWAALPSRVVFRHQGGSKTRFQPGRHGPSLATGWCQGFLEGALIAFLGLYLFERSYSPAGVAWFTTLIMMGVIAVQVPLAWIADRFGRTRLIFACYGITLLGLVSAPLAADSLWLIFWFFLIGTGSSSLYPLGLAHLGDETEPANLDRANAHYLLFNCLGSLTGPFATGVFMDRFGSNALCYTGIGAVGLVLTVWGWRMKPQFGMFLRSKRHFQGRMKSFGKVPQPDRPRLQKNL